MSRKPSRQALRTKKMLQDALVSLVQEQEFGNLRVQDITERADLGRATFYLHYSDKEDLLTAIVDQSFQEMAERLEVAGSPDGFIGLKWALEYAGEDPELFQVVMNHPKTVNRIRSLIVERIMQDFHGEARSDPQVHASAHILAGSVLGVFNWWLSYPDKLSPDQLLQIFSEIVSNGAKNYLTI